MINELGDKISSAHALVLFSGGQDSSICLAWALQRYASVETLGFVYGQRHDVEMTARQRVRSEIADRFPEWRAKLGKDTILDASALGQISDSALTVEKEVVADGDGLPNTFVPGRNLLFMVLAASYMHGTRLEWLVGGMCEEDSSGYPDCRRSTLDAQLTAINLGMETKFKIDMPLMAMSKADSWVLAQELGGASFVDIIREHSHTCYLGNREKLHNWGYGCGDCPACKIRKNGWDEFQRR